MGLLPIPLLVHQWQAVDYRTFIGMNAVKVYGAGYCSHPRSSTGSGPVPEVHLRSAYCSILSQMAVKGRVMAHKEKKQTALRVASIRQAAIFSPPYSLLVPHARRLLPVMAKGAFSTQLVNSVIRVCQLSNTSSIPSTQAQSSFNVSSIWSMIKEWNSSNRSLILEGLTNSLTYL